MKLKYKDMKQLFVPYELALLAKEKGFETNDVLAVYYNNQLYIGQSASDTRTYADYTAPLYQQLVDWFREKHRMHLTVKFDVMDNTQEPFVGNIEGNGKIRFRYFDTYYGCFNLLLTEAFKLV